MKTIKKVSVSPLPRNEASVIDSLDSGDDQTINAPSIHAVNEGLNGKANSSHTHTKSDITDFAHNHDDRYYTKTEADTIQTGTATATSSTGSIDFTFKRNGNVVSVKAVLNMNTNLDTVQVMGAVSIPDFAKPTNTGTFASGCIFGSYSIDTTNFELSINSVAKFGLTKASNGNYNVIATGGDGTPQPTGESWTMFATYIVD